MSRNYASTSDWGKIKNRKSRMKYEDYDEDYDMDNFNASDMDYMLDDDENKEVILEEEIIEELPVKRFDLDSYLFDINLYQSKEDIKNISKIERNKVLDNLLLASVDIQKTKEYKKLLKMFNK